MTITSLGQLLCLRSQGHDLFAVRGRTIFTGHRIQEGGGTNIAIEFSVCLSIYYFTTIAILGKNLLRYIFIRLNYHTL